MAGSSRWLPASRLQTIGVTVIVGRIHFEVPKFLRNGLENRSEKGKVDLIEMKPLNVYPVLF